MKMAVLRVRVPGGRPPGWLPVALAVAAMGAPPDSVVAQAGADAHERACQRGNASSCALLALTYESGAARDPARAAELYRRACTGGVAASCTSLGAMYQSGVGVPRDLGRAEDLFLTGCAQGDSEACDLSRVLAGAGDPAQLTSARVEDPTGQPLAEAIVELPELGIVAITDLEGRVELGLVPVGSHVLRIERFGYEPVAGTLEVTASAELLVVLTPARVADTTRPGQVVGRVIDADSGEGLPDVQISLPGTSTGTLSGAGGGFALRGVEPGLRRLRFERIGYGTQTAMVVVQPGGAVEVAAGMSTEAIELDPLAVTVGTAFDRRAFDARSRAGWGTHFSPEELDRISPQRVSDVIRGRVRGVTTVTDYLGTRVVSRRSLTSTADSLDARRRLGAGADSADIRSYMSTAQFCSMSVYLDGMPVVDFDIDALDPRSIDAIEVYHGLGTPIQYLANRCGAVLIWTGRGR